LQDILAVAQDVEGGVDFDAELATVAAANAAAGLAGVGFTGSYIFSQTVWTLRHGVLSRVNGWVIVAAELAAFAAPFSVTQFLPNFFLGALLCWFGFEIARDWLVLSYWKLSGVEYGLLWGTFLAIVQLGLERGIAAGVAGACVYFCWAYARSQLRSLELAGPARRSGVVRTVEQRAALDLLGPRCARAARLRGFCFFASAPNIARRLEEASAALAAPGGGGAALGDGYARGAARAAALAALEAAPRFLLLDFSRVTGMDASGARAVAGAVLAARAATGVEPVLAAADRHGALELLAAHGLAARRMRWPPALPPADGGGAAAAAPAAPDDAGAEVPLFPTAEEALRYCEDALLAAATRSGLIPPPSAALPLEALLRSHLDGGAPEVAAPESAAAAASALRRFGAARRLRRGERLWALGDPAAAMFLVEAGELRVDELRRTPPPPPGAGAAPASGRVALWADPPAGARLELVRSFELGPGCVLGATDFYLGRAHRTVAACASPEARVLELSREALRRMAAEAPAALNLLQAVVMRLNASDLAAAAEMAAGAEP
jgi:SulP family sulfate permease